jgi:hypothetical protein
MYCSNIDVTAHLGPANGILTRDVQVFESSQTSPNTSLQRCPDNPNVWKGSIPNTTGLPNANCYPTKSSTKTPSKSPTKAPVCQLETKFHNDKFTEKGTNKNKYQSNDKITHQGVDKSSNEITYQCIKKNFRQSSG